MLRLFAFSLILCAPVAFAQRTISFSGYNWGVKSSTGRVGPGPNYFSSSTNDVWVDTSGRLHLRIQKSGNKWQCAEVWLNGTLGYGTYKFYLDSVVDNLDPNVVLGLFTWSDNPAYNDRELDIEFSRWSDKFNQNAQYVVQPYDVAGNTFRWQEPANQPQTTHTFLWKSDSVFFQSWTGQTSTAGPVISQHLFTQGIPPTGDEKVHINLWLNQGRAPSNNKAAEVVITRFEFVPAI
jgi:hypothetical protein